MLEVVASISNSSHRKIAISSDTGQVSRVDDRRALQASVVSHSVSDRYELGGHEHFQTVASSYGYF
jgi:hypothetical protein